MMCHRQHGTQEDSGWLGLSTRACQAHRTLFVSRGMVAMVQIASLSLGYWGMNFPHF